MTTRLLGRSVGRVIFYLGPSNVYKRGSQFGSETVAQYKTLPSFPGLARSSLAVRNPAVTKTRDGTGRDEGGTSRPVPPTKIRD